MTGTNILETLQADVAAVLRNTPSLNYANVLVEDAGNMEAEILRKLGTLTGNGISLKKGLVIVVMLPEVNGVESNLPGPPIDIVMEIQCIEQAVVNRDAASGTLIPSSQAALLVLGALHHRGLASASLTAGDNAVQAVRGIKPGFLSHAVKLSVNFRGLEPSPRVLAVNAAWQEDDTLLLATMTGDAAIWYTTDGSYPTPTNTEATIYTAPIAGLAVGTVVRAAAYDATSDPSDLTEITVVSNVAPGTIPWEEIGVPWERL